MSKENENSNNEDIRFDLNMPDEVSETDDRIITGKNKVRIILYILAFIAIAAIISYFSFVYAMKNPKDTVIKAYNKTVSEVFSAEKAIDTKAVRNLVFAEPTDSSLSVTVKNIDYKGGSLLKAIINSGFTVSVKYDPEAKNASGAIDASVAGMPVNVANFYADNASLCGNISLLEKEYLSIPLENIFSAYNSSQLSDHIGKFEYTDDLSVDLFDFSYLTSLKSASELMEGYLLSDNERFSDFKESLAVTKISDTYKLDNGKSAKGYSVVVDGEQINSILSGFEEYAKEQNDYLPLAEKILPIAKVISRNDKLTADQIADSISSANYEMFSELGQTAAADDYEIKVYVYKNRMVRAEGVLSLDSLQQGELRDYFFAISYPSGKSAADKIMIEFYPVDTPENALTATVENNEGEYTLNIESNFSFYDAPYSMKVKADYSKLTSQYNFDASFSNSENENDTLTLASSGTLTQTEDSFALSADKLEYSTMGHIILSLGVDIDVNPLQEAIEKPTEEPINIFTADFETLSAIVDEMKQSYGGIAAMAGLVGLGG